MTAIDMRIFAERAFSGTPARITSAIEALAREVSPQHGLTFVRCEPDGEPAECFFNVQRRVERDGGELLNGWIIWEWRSVYVEAEHHAVWRNGGALLDVTPHVPMPEERILFLPDPDRHYDWEGGKRLPNVLHALSRVPAAAELRDASRQLHAYIESCSVGRMARADRGTIAILSNAASQARGRVLEQLARVTKPSEPCICRSGRKFRKCCRPYIDHDA